jgi:hypothetical protein
MRSCFKNEEEEEQLLKIEEQGRSRFKNEEWPQNEEEGRSLKNEESLQNEEEQLLKKRNGRVT